MRKRDRNRQWTIRWIPEWGEEEYVGDSRNKENRLKEVSIGEWLKVTLIEGAKNRKEQYRVQFGDETWVVSIMDNGDASINLQWAKSLVDANPVNIGKLNR